MRRIQLLLLFCIFQSSKAQYSVGLANSNYGGTNTMYLNPANLADSKFKYYVNLGQINHNFSNNYVKWQADYPYWFVFAVGTPIPAGLKSRIGGDSYSSENNKLSLETNVVSGVGAIGIDGSVSKIKGEIGFEAKLLSVMAEIPKLKSNVAMGMRFRGNVTFDNVTPPIAQIISQGTNGNPFIPINVSFPNQSMNLNMNAFHETSIGFGTKVFENENSLFKVGATVKYLGGLFNMGVNAEDFSLKLSKTAEEIQLKNGNTENLTIVRIEKATNVSANITNETSLRPFIQNLTTNPINAINPWYLISSKSAGRGIGGDIGFVYEFLDPDLDITSRKYKGLEKTVNRYIFKFGASVNDIGRIRFKPNGNRDNDAIKNFSQPLYDGSLGDIPIDAYRLNRFTFKEDKPQFADNWFSAISPLSTDPIVIEGYTTGLPTNLTLNVDYKLLNKVYIGGILVQNLNFLNSNYAMRASSVLAAIPRYETKYFEASLPILIRNQYSNVQVGMGLRAGPIVMGTDHIFSLLNIGNQRGADFYIGANVPIYHKPIRKTADDLGQDNISLMQRIREALRKRHLRKLHKKAMKQG